MPEQSPLLKAGRDRHRDTHWWGWTDTQRAHSHRHRDRFTRKPLGRHRLTHHINRGPKTHEQKVENSDPDSLLVRWLQGKVLLFLSLMRDRCGFGDSGFITSVFKPCIPLSKLFLLILKNLLKEKKASCLKFSLTPGITFLIFLWMQSILMGLLSF